MKRKNNNKTSIILSIVFLILSIIAIITILTVSPKSAYNIAVKNGFQGTEQQWIESLKGVSGEMGKTIEQITAENLNAKLKDVDTTNYQTASERFRNAGILDEQLERLTKRYLYSYKDNKIIVIDDAGYVAYSTSSYENDTLLLNGNDLFCFTTSDNLSSDYSNYLIGGDNSVLNISTGLDVGSVSNVSTINFNKAENEDKIIISTNSEVTTLNIDDKSNSSICHFGKVGIINIVECDTSSYHEYGTASFIEIAKGRIVLEPTSKIQAIHIDSKKENDISTDAFDSIIAELGTDIDVPGYDEDLLKTLTSDLEDIDDIIGGYGLLDDDNKAKIEHNTEVVKRESEAFLNGAEQLAPRSQLQPSQMDGNSVNNKDIVQQTEDAETAPTPLQRRYIVCPKCGASYHIVYNPPKTENVCDKCGSELAIRPDDNPEVVADRLAVYHKKTAPLENYYEAQGKLRRAKGCELLSDTSANVRKALEEGVGK